MVQRGLCAPIMDTTDGAPGLIRAVTEVFPHSLRQRCLAHKMRNVTPKERAWSAGKAFVKRKTCRVERLVQRPKKGSERLTKDMEDSHAEASKVGPYVFLSESSSTKAAGQSAGVRPLFSHCGFLGR